MVDCAVYGKAMVEEHLLSIDEVTHILNIPPDTVHQWIENGTLNPTEAGGELRFHPEDIRTLFEEREAKSSRRKKRILIVDDDPLVSKSLHRLLEENGYEPQVASFGLAALDLACREPFDLIVTDIRMPGMNGLQVLKAIGQMRSRSGKRPVPAVVITAFDEGEVREEARRVGISDFILKPFDIGELSAALERNLREDKNKPAYAF